MVELKKEINFDIGCEECGIVEELLDTITEGRAMRLCRRCAIANNSLILEKRREEEPKKEKPYKKSPETFTLSDLYEKYKEIKARKQQMEILDENKFYEDLEKEEKIDMDEIKKAINEKEIEFDFTPEKTKKLKVKDLLKIALEKIKGKKENKEDGSQNS